MRLLLTRPQEDAAESLAALAAAGHAVLHEPLLTLRPLPAALPDPAGFQALLVTSRNGLRAFAAASPERALPVYAVGPASAAAALAAGFTRVRDAEGDAAALAALVGRELDPAAGPLLHPAGREVAGGLSAALTAAGFRLQRVVLYAAEPARALSPAARTALEQGTLDGVLFYSPRTAETFVDLIAGTASGQACRDLTAWCLSPAVAQAARALPWRAVRTAEEPNQAALLALLGRADPEAAADPQRQARGRGMSEGRDQGDERDRPEANEETPSNAAERVIARFGGIRPMATKLGVAVSTVQGWKARGHIPPGRRAQVEAAAAELGLELEAADLEGALAEEQGPAAEPEEREPAAAPETGAAAETGTSLETEQRAETPWRSVGGRAEAQEPPEGAATAAAAEPAPPTRPSPLPAMLLGATLVAAGALGAVLLRDLWLPPAAPPAAAAIEALERRMARVEEQRIDASPEGLRALEQELEQLRGRLDDYDATLAGIGEEIGSDVAAIESLRTLGERLAERLEALEQAAEAGSQAGEAAATAAAEGLARAEALEEQLQGLAARIEAVAEAPAEADELTLARLQALDGRLEGAAGRIEALEARLRDALAEVETARARVGEETALALSAGQLREALRIGSPFAAELESLRRLAGRDEALAQVLAALETHAAVGVASLPALQASFPEAAARAVTAERAAGAEQDWQALFWNRVSDLVTVRAIGEPEGEGTEAVLARAERRLEAGDLAAAEAELAALQGAAAEAMAAWRSRAQARLEAEAALAGLARASLGRVGGGEG